jgi:iron complex outermembrane receptor protein
MAFPSSAQSAPASSRPPISPPLTFSHADNGNRTEEDFNDATYSGFRLAGLYTINADWSLQVSHMQSAAGLPTACFSPIRSSATTKITRFQNDEHRRRVR